MPIQKPPQLPPDAVAALQTLNNLCDQAHPLAVALVRAGMLDVHYDGVQPSVKGIAFLSTLNAVPVGYTQVEVHPANGAPELWAVPIGFEDCYAIEAAIPRDPKGLLLSLQVVGMGGRFTLEEVESWTAYVRASVGVYVARLRMAITVKGLRPHPTPEVLRPLRADWTEST